MSDIEKFSVVRTVAIQGSLSRVQVVDPADEATPALTFAHGTLGVTMTASSDTDLVTVLRDGYMRSVGSGDITGWEPSIGSALWCGTAGKVTTTRPTVGALILIGTYIGAGVVDVHVKVLPAIGELSFVKRDVPALYDVLIWNDTDGLFEPRQLDHNVDLANLTEGDPHTQYSLREDFTNLFLFMGAN